MKEYLKMADIFGDIAVKVRGSNGRHVMCEDILAANCFCTDSANHIAHAINSHDELVAEVERLRGTLQQCVDALCIAHKFCGNHTADECGDEIAIPISDALVVASKLVAQ